MQKVQNRNAPSDRGTFWETAVNDKMCVSISTIAPQPAADPADLYLAPLRGVVRSSLRGLIHACRDACPFFVVYVAFFLSL